MSFRRYDKPSSSRGNRRDGAIGSVRLFGGLIVRFQKVFFIQLPDVSEHGQNNQHLTLDRSGQASLLSLPLIPGGVDSLSFVCRNGPKIRIADNFTGLRAFRGWNI